MAVEQSAFRYAYRFGATSYVLRVSTEFGSAEDLNFPLTGSLSLTSDYFFSGDGSATDLFQLLSDCLNGHTTISSNTVTLDANHKLSIDPIGGLHGDITLLWSHANTTLDPTIFGWTTGVDSSADDPLVSPNVPYGLIYLDRPVSVDGRPRQSIVGGISRSVSGLTRAAYFASPNKDRSLSVKLMPQEYALDEYAAADAPFSTFESMHVRALALGRPMHFVPDSSDEGTYSVMYLAPPLVDNLRRDQSYTLRWSWEADFIVSSEVTP